MSRELERSVKSRGLSLLDFAGVGIDAKASASNYTLCAEREMLGIGYSYTLWERGAEPAWALWRPNGDADPRFVRLVAKWMRP
jgi:hypothetical protein